MSGQSPLLGRRSLLKAGLVTAAAGVVAPFAAESLTQAARAAGPHKPVAPRQPNSLPYPSLPVGQYTGAFYFDHLVIVMQENHSFDNYLGMLPLSGQPKADGFTFNRKGEPVDWNPVGNERMYVYHQSGEDGATDSGSQSWDDSHIQINNGAMNGFALTGPGSMGYYTEDDLPFYYSLAKAFTLANRWFCSVPAQTYPNRRFLMAGTASGVVSTDTDNIDIYPANGTIWDRLSSYGISWKNYFTDLPTSAIIEDTVLRHPTHYARIEEFYVDAAAGTLPSVTLVDCDYGAITGEVGGELSPPTFGSTPSTVIDNTAESEENPQNVQLGEA
jgi:phospholipase C